MNVFGFTTLDAILGLITFAGGGIFFGFILQFIRFVMFGLMDTNIPKSGKEVKKYDYT
jgi:hypothetical protein